MASAACGSCSPLAGGRSKPSARSARCANAVKVASEGRGVTDIGGGGAGPARPERARLAGGHPLLLLDRALTLDAVARERQRFEPLLGDFLAAPLAAAERAIVDLLQRGDHIAQEPTVAVAELEEELARVGGVRLV